MDVLCSDKTGTLTTAKMSINLDMIWAAKKEGFSVIDPYLYRQADQELALKQMLLVMGIMASNADKKDDAIDGALLRAWDEMQKKQGEGPKKMKEGYQQLDLTGFNPEVKRTAGVLSVRRLYISYIICHVLCYRLLCALCLLHYKTCDISYDIMLICFVSST